MKNIAIIPARGESQRIPRKNIKEFAGRPIIEYSIEAAQKSRLFHEIMVSTDDEEIAAISKAAGASVPWLRPDEFSGPDVPMSEVIRSTLAEYSRRNFVYETCCMIYATAPMIDPEDIRAGFEILAYGCRAAAVISVVENPVQLEYAMIIEDGMVRYICPEAAFKNAPHTPTYSHAEQWWWFNIPKWFINGTLLPWDTRAYILPSWKVTPINTEDDWARAELQYRMVQEAS